jgi:hypothetical protein
MTYSMYKTSLSQHLCLHLTDCLSSCPPVCLSGWCVCVWLQLAVSDGAAFNNLKTWIKDHESKYSKYQVPGAHAVMNHRTCFTSLHFSIASTIVAITSVVSLFIFRVIIIFTTACLHNNLLLLCCCGCS